MYIFCRRRGKVRKFKKIFPLTCHPHHNRRPLSWAWNAENSIAPFNYHFSKLVCLLAIKSRRLWLPSHTNCGKKHRLSDRVTICAFIHSTLTHKFHTLTQITSVRKFDNMAGYIKCREMLITMVFINLDIKLYSNWKKLGFACSHVSFALLAHFYAFSRNEMRI